MGANHSQPKDHKEERKAKRSPTLPTLLGKTSSRLNLLNFGRRSPQPPATPVTPQAVMVIELAAGQGTASPEASAADPEDRPEMTVEVSQFPLFIRLWPDCAPAVADCTPDINTHLAFSLSPIFSLHIHNHQDQESDLAIVMPPQPATVACQVSLWNHPCNQLYHDPSVDLSRLTFLIRTRWL